MNIDNIHNEHLKFIQSEIEAGHYKSMDIDEDVGLYYCISCKANISGVASFITHANGKKHLKQAAKSKRTSAANVDDFLISQISNLSTSEQFSSSGSSSSSREESLERRGVSPVNIMDRSINIEESIRKGILKSEGNGYKCNVCDLSSLTSDVVAKQHIEGSKHLKKLRASKSNINLDISFEKVFASTPIQKITVSNPSLEICKKASDSSNPYYCPYCDVTLNSESQYEAHETGKSHQKKKNPKSSLQLEPRMEELPKRTVDFTPSTTDFSNELIIIKAHEILMNHPCFSN